MCQRNGVHKDQKWSYTFPGADNFTANVFVIKVTGTYTR
jgi:hypothetical protein